MLLGLPDFEILSPDTLEEACSLLSRHGREARPFAGGTDLLTKMKHKRVMPRILVNLKGIGGLDWIEVNGSGELHIGGLTTIEAIKDSPLVGKSSPILNQAAGVVGTTQIRNLGTIGGNLANASPSAEFGPPLLVLQGSVRCVRQDGERLVPIEVFFVSPGTSALAPEEVLVEVRVPPMPAGAKAIYLKHSLRRMDVAIAAAAVYLEFDADYCREARIALGAVAPTPVRARAAEQALQGRRLPGGPKERELLEEVGRIAAEESRPIDDLRELASYRRRVVAMLVRQGLEQVIGKARKGEQARRPV